MKKVSPLLIVGIIIAIAIFPIYYFLIKPKLGSGDTANYPVLNEDWPLHFCLTSVDSRWPLSSAIPNDEKITEAGGSVTTHKHSGSDKAQLRLIKLPMAIHGTKEAAKVLAASGAVRNGDILVETYTQWAKANAYGNVQLGAKHIAVSTIRTEGGETFVHTVESPLNYSSALDSEHYKKERHKTFHILRPDITETQGANVAKWGRLLFEKDKVKFHTNYDEPYSEREEGKDELSIGFDLAAAALFDGPVVGAYCSEFSWGLFSLRDIDPDDVIAKFADGDAKGDKSQYIASRIKPLFSLRPGATKTPVSNPGLIQGPDVLLRQVMSDDDQRHAYLVEKVLIEENSSPTQLKAYMSDSHIETARGFEPKVVQVRGWYANGEDMSKLAEINFGMSPNYSPTSYLALANSTDKVIGYVGTVVFE